MCEDLLEMRRDTCGSASLSVIKSVRSLQLSHRRKDHFFELDQSDVGLRVLVFDMAKLHGKHPGACRAIVFL